MDDNRKTAITAFSQAGAAKLREMTENSDVYTDFLKFQGRVYKHGVHVSLEFFTQKPETQFIATEEQWRTAHRTVAQGSEAIRFVDKNGRFSDFYDFSQIEESAPPQLWAVSARNVTAVKAALSIPAESTLMNGLVNATIKPAHITACMSALQIPPSDFGSFSKSFVNAVQLVLAGRLEVGGNSFVMEADTSALKLLQTESQKLFFFTHIANIAREALKNVESVIQNLDTKERSARNDLREMADADRRGANEYAGRGAADHSGRAADEQSNRSENDAPERRAGLGNHTDGEGRQEHEMVSGVPDEADIRREVLVQVPADQRAVYAESDRGRTDNGRGANRDIRNAVDDVHGKGAPTSGDGNAVPPQVSDSSAFRGQGSVGVPGAAGRAIRQGESPSGGLRGNAALGTGTEVFLGQRGDAGTDFDAGDGALTEKLNHVFSQGETAKASTEPAGAFALREEVDTYINFPDAEDITDAERLVQLTAEMESKKAAVTALMQQAAFERAAATAQELAALDKTAAQLKEKLQEEAITEADVQSLREIRPARKSVQNLLEHEVAQTPKFEKLLGTELGEKSAYEMRKTNNVWREDDSKTVPVIAVAKRDISAVRSDIKSAAIERGDFLNQDTGILINFGRVGIDGSIAHALQEVNRDNPTEPRLAVLYQMREMIENAVCFDSQLSEKKKKSPNSLFMHRMYAVFNYDGASYLANLSVDESYITDINNAFSDTAKRLYNVKSIKITPVGDLGFQSHGTSFENDGEPTDVTTISVPQLYEIVKTYDKNFFENAHAAGRDAREAELLVQAEYTDATAALDAGAADIIPAAAPAQLEQIAQAHGMEQTEAEAALRKQSAENALLRPISSERRKELLEAFAKQYELAGDVFVYRQKGAAEKTYCIAEKSGKDYAIRAQLFTLEPGEYFSEKKLTEALAAFSDSDVFREYLESRRAQGSLPEADTDINFLAQARAMAMTAAEKTAFLNQTEQSDGSANPVDIALNDILTNALRSENEHSLFQNLLQESGYTQVFNNPFAQDGSMTPEDFRQMQTELLREELPEDVQHFLHDDITAAVVKAQLAWDEIEDIGRWFYEENEGQQPHENAIYGMGLRETQLAALVERMRSGENVDRELVSGIFRGNGTAYFSVETSAGDITLYANPTEQGFNFVYSPTGSKESWERELSFAELGAELHKLVHDEYERLYGTEIDVPEQQPKEFYRIYQLKEEEKYHGIRFTGYDRLQADGVSLTVSDYNCVYEGLLSDVQGSSPDEKLNAIYEKFNLNRPEDFKGYSLSVSDVVTLEAAENETAYFVDRFGFKQLDRFLPEHTPEQQPDSESREKADLHNADTSPTKKHRLTKAEQLYRQFTEMFPTLTDGTHSYERYGKGYEESGDEPLSVEHLGGCEYGFMTYYMQNGDVMRDPDFTFALDHENKRLIIHEYQQDGVPGVGTLYQRVFDDNGNADEKLLAALEENFLQNLKAAKAMERPLTKFTDQNGSSTTLREEEKVDTSINFSADSSDATPELREVLNAFSEKHGLVELNVSLYRQNWTLVESFQDGATHTLGDIMNPEYGTPFTPESLSEALEKFEAETESRQQKVSALYSRQGLLNLHGGLSALPKVQENLPEIAYASQPSTKISDNVTAIREMLRLEEAEKYQQPLYDARSNQYNSKQASEQRLRRYCGWGGLPQVFDERFQQYNYNRKQLQELLSPEEYAAARESTLNAHYTPQIIIDAMYGAVKNMDLPRDSRILEPSCGTGNFISRLPHSLGNAEVVGVELDSVTARIAKQLTRDNAHVRIIESGFEHAGLQDNSFDLAIGNVPFGDYNLNDPDYVQDWRIHDAFFRKALDKVAAGGVVAFVTSSGTMDKTNPKVREYLATKAELIGAIRLPNNAFSDAGTKVTSDIIFLKKRETPLQAHAPKPDWCYTVPNADGLKMNSYFVANPQMVLGKMEQTTHFGMLTCTPFDGADLATQLFEAVKQLNAKITVTRRERMAQAQRGEVEPWGKNFTYQCKDGKAFYRQNDTMNEIKCTGKEYNKLESLCELRSTARSLIDMQKSTASDEQLLPIRTQLNQQYDAYLELYGTISDTAARFGNDADYPLLLALETAEGRKADIFFRRTVNPTVEITAASSLEEALQVSIDRKGKPDIPYMAMLLDAAYPDLSTAETSEHVCKALLDKGYIFIDPTKQVPERAFSGVVERSEYLSGNVRMKLTLAEEYAKADSAYLSNVAALQSVIPEDIRAEEISMQLGCPWIEPEDYTAFLTHLSGRSGYNQRSCEVTYSPVTGEFDVLNAGSKAGLNLNETTTYGTKDYNLYQLAEKILNQRRITVKRVMPNPKDSSKTITRTDPKATKIALDKAKSIRAEFAKWIFAEPERKARYERKYNDIFNSLVGREFDGSKLSFPGMTTLNDFALRPHQKNCVARAIYGGNTLAAHVVGAGKSAVMFTTVMKKKELGLINKACVVVPKPLTEQTAREWRELYPDARILTVTNDDLSTEAKRNLFTARVATGSFDAVVMSQEQFEKIAMSKPYRIQFMQKELDSLEDMLREKTLENGGRKDYSTKAIEKAKKQLKARMEKLLNPKSAARAKDDLLEFEQLGFDYLVVDEAHAYKNGFVTTKMTEVAGVTTRPSGRAEDMQMKCDYFNEVLGQGHILFATGTPVSNSMTELYVMTRYLRPDLLRQAGVERFDDWAATFGNVVTKNKQSADGTLKLRTCFASFANLPELIAMYKEFADIQSADKLQLPRPRLKTGKPQIIKVPESPEQKAYVQELAARSKAIADGKVEPSEDNMLKISGEARLIGMSNLAVQALYAKRNEELPFDFLNTKDCKVDKCVEKVAELYRQTTETKGVQIVFSDIAVNADNGNFSVYDYIKQELTETYGIPESEIIYAPKSDSKDRANIFKAINAGEKRIVLASTGTLGTGANIQQNLYAVHHIDVPWKPSDFEQREGRILRQGNRNEEVEIFNYVTEGTLDSYLYQTVTDKARFIAQLLDDKCPARVSEDCDEKVLTFGEIQAAAEGNPDFKRRIELANEVAEITMLRN